MALLYGNEHVVRLFKDVINISFVGHRVIVGDFSHSAVYYKIVRAMVTQ